MRFVLISPTADVPEVLLDIRRSDNGPNCPVFIGIVRRRATPFGHIMSDTQPTAAAGPPPLPPDLPHDSLKLNIIISSTICWWIAAFFVGLRFYTRGVIIRVLGWSDWSILLALVRPEIELARF